MAVGRMLAKSISMDARVNALRVDDSAGLHPAEVQLFFTWCVPHQDAYGVLPGDPAVLRAMVFPRKDFSIVQIQAMIDAICDCGLAERFEVAHDVWLWFHGFSKNNENLNPSLESDHPYPYPPNMSAEERADEDFRRAENLRKAAEGMANLRAKRAAANGETPKPRKPAKGKDSPELVAIRGYFYYVSGVAPNSHINGPYTNYMTNWKNPLESILEGCGNDLERAKRVVAAMVRIAKSDGMSIKTPHSIMYAYSKATESLNGGGGRKASETFSQGGAS